MRQKYRMKSCTRFWTCLPMLKENHTGIIFMEEEDGFHWSDYPEKKPLTERQFNQLRKLNPKIFIIAFKIVKSQKNDSNT